MKKTLKPIVPAFILATALAFGQNSAGVPSAANRVQHRIGFLTTILNLTAAQQQQATTIFTNASSADASVRASMKSARQSLTAAIRNNDSATIVQVSATIGNLTAQSTSNQAKADAAFYQILTPDQQAKLTQFESQGRAGFGRGMRPGGMRP